MPMRKKDLFLPVTSSRGWRGIRGREHQSAISYLTSSSVNSSRRGEVKTLLHPAHTIEGIHYSDAVTQRHPLHGNAYEVRSALDNGFNHDGWLSTISTIVWRRVETFQDISGISIKQFLML